MSDEIERVTRLVAEILKRSVDEIPPEALLVQDLGADSMSGLELWVMLEQEFGIVIPPEDIPALETVASSARVVRRILNVE